MAGKTASGPTWSFTTLPSGGGGTATDIVLYAGRRAHGRGHVAGGQ